MKKNKRKIILTATLALSGMMSFAQSTGINKAKTALNTIVTDVSGLFDTVTKVMFVVAAIVGLLGGIQVYSKFQSGDPNTTKLAGAWFGAALFVVAAGVFLRAIFL